MEGHEGVGLRGAGGERGAGIVPSTVGCWGSKQSEVALNAGQVAVRRTLA